MRTERLRLKTVRTSPSLTSMTRPYRVAASILKASRMRSKKARTKLRVIIPLEISRGIMTRNFVLAFLLLILLAFNIDAATLYGRVIEVNDGDVLTVFNLNRSVRIKLMAVDAPESSQAFGEVAKKHLGELAYDKQVLVEYWGIAADASLVGRVTLNGADIGAQMIRDGAAWFD